MKDPIYDKAKRDAAQILLDTVKQIELIDHLLAYPQPPDFAKYLKDRRSDLLDGLNFRHSSTDPQS